ncbi:hypothetical protein [uncultured Shewanella sp.]|uniref:hypothetical protein n=1 Tax=uncultured Shewanella sp. TaxID=173975 RepID=UPI00262F6763|nr:hypothetical protein [uncultured Shewanella sp.]
MKLLTFVVLLFISLNSYANVKGEDLIYAQLLSDPHLSNIKLGAKAMHHELPNNQVLWDFTAYTLWKTINNADSEHDEFDDTNAWLIKALTEYKSPRYRVLLVELNTQKQSSKIKRYLKKALKSLPKNSQHSFDIQTYEAIDISAIQPQQHATKALFQQLQLGSTLDIVLKTLGDPNDVGQYLNHKFRFFIGGQTFQNLRLTYSNIGSMELRYDANKWVVDKKSLQANHSLMDIPPQYQDLVSRLISNDAPQIKAAAREAMQLPLSDEQSLDVLAQYLWNNRTTQDKYMADSMAWLCKVLGHSNNGRYKAFLEMLATSDAHEKIAHYAEGSAENLLSQVNGFTPELKTRS